MVKTNPGTRRSLGTQTSASGDTGGGVVVRTPANNSRAYNPGGTSGTGVRKSPQAVDTPGGRNVIRQKGWTVAGTNKTIR